MSKKRLIFVLLYLDGQFCISRNFRLQKVGNADWLARNYNFSKVSRFIDELVILNVGSPAGADTFLDNVTCVTADVFIPVALGGAIRSPEDAAHYFDHGADKVVVNTLLWKQPEAVRAVADVYGEQAVVASVDYRTSPNGDRVPYLRGEAVPDVGSLTAWMAHVADLGVGEILLNSVDRDGTGMGLDLPVLGAIPPSLHQPLVLMGGVGRTDHFQPGIERVEVSGVATANLFAFIADSLASARRRLLDNKMTVASFG